MAKEMIPVIDFGPYLAGVPGARATRQSEVSRAPRLGAASPVKTVWGASASVKRGASAAKMTGMSVGSCWEIY